MGNNICCEEEPKKQFDHTITVVHKQEVVKIPQLNQVVAAHLAKQKPFFNELLENKATIKQFGYDVYEGSVDERGRPNRFGKMYHKNGSVFVGQFVAGVANGQGHFVKPDGSYYHGKMKNNMANDESGYFWSPQFQYKGSIVNNKISGTGSEKGSNHEFQGEYKQGKKIYGKLRWREGENEYEYIGPFNDQENFEGKGKLWQNSKGVYTGMFVNGNKHGTGEFLFESGLKYEGQYYHNIKEGYGKLTNKVGKIVYEGEFKSGMPHGIGKAPNSKGELKERSWIQGIDRLMIQQ